MGSPTIRCLTVTVVLFVASARAAQQAVSRGCVDVSSTFDNTTDLAPNGLPVCQQYCSDLGYHYFGMSAQYETSSVCW